MHQHDIWVLSGEPRPLPCVARCITMQWTTGMSCACCVISQLNCPSLVLLLRVMCAQAVEFRLGGSVASSFRTALGLFLGLQGPKRDKFGL